jgi:hypothetical protein
MDSKSWESVCGPRNEDYTDVGCMKGSGAMQAAEHSQQEGHMGISADATEV